MWKVSILSLMVCVLLMASCYFGGVRPEAIDTFKKVLGCYGFIFVVSTMYAMYELHTDREKDQPKLGEV